VKRRIVAATAAGLAILLAAPTAAGAHGLVGKQDLPIPRWLFAWAAAAVLVVSFLGLALLWPRPRLQSAAERAIARLPRLLDPLCGALGVAAFAFLIYAGFAGAQSAQTNVLPTVVYVVFWVGLPCASLLLGKPVAGDRAPHGLGCGARAERAAAAARVPPAARALAGSVGHPRLRLDRARVHGS